MVVSGLFTLNDFLPPMTTDDHQFINRCSLVGIGGNCSRCELGFRGHGWNRSIQERDVCVMVNVLDKKGPGPSNLTGRLCHFPAGVEYVMQTTQP